MQVRVTAPLEVDGGSTEAVRCCLLGALWTSPLEVEGRCNALWQKLQQRQRWHAAYVDGEDYMLSALGVDGFVVHRMGMALSEGCLGMERLFGGVRQQRKVFLSVALARDCFFGVCQLGTAFLSVA